MVSRRDGSLPVSAPHPLGLYRDDCRFLSGHELCVNGVRPRLLVASAARGSESVHELTNPALPLPGGRILPLQSLQLRLERRIVGDDEIEETAARPLLRPRAALPRPRSAAGRRLRADAGDPRHPGHRARASRSPSSGARTACASPSAAATACHRATHRHRRPPGRAGRGTSTSCASRSACRRAARRRSRCATACTRARPRPAASAAATAPAPRRSADAWLAERTVVETDDELFNRVLRRSLLDIRMLHSRRGGDGLLRRRRAVVRDAVRPRLADHGDAAARLRPRHGRADAARARRADRHARRPGHDEEPGKVIHELRVGRGGAARALPARPLLRHGRRDAAVPVPAVRRTRTGPATWRCSASCAPQVEAMLGWIDGPGDRDGDGLLEYRQRAPSGPAQPGLEGLRRGRARRARGAARAAGHARGAAGVRVPREAAARAAVRARRRRRARAEALLREAAELRERLERFWLPERGYYSMGCGGDARPSRALASNQGHLLWALAVAARARGGDPRLADVRRDVLGLGDPHAGRGRGGLQPRRLPPRHGLAARHRDDRLRAAQVRLRRGLRPRLRGAARGGGERGGLPAARALRGLRPDGVRDAGALPGRVPAAGLGGGRDPLPHRGALGLVPDALERRLRVRRPSLAALALAGRGPRPAGRRLARSTCCSSARAPAGRWRSSTRASRATSRSCSRSRASRGPSGPLGAAVPLVLERPARADRPGLHAVGDRDGLGARPAASTA